MTTLETQTIQETETSVSAVDFRINKSGLNAEWTPKDYAGVDIKVAPMHLLGPQGHDSYRTEPSDHQKERSKAVVKETQKLAAALERDGIVTYVSPQFQLEGEQAPPVKEMSDRDVAMHVLLSSLENADVAREEMPNTYYSPAEEKERAGQGLVRSKSLDNDAATTRRTISIVRKPVAEGAKDAPEDPNEKFLVVDTRHEVTMQDVVSPFQPAGRNKDNPLMIKRPVAQKVIQVRYETIGEVNSDKDKIKAQAKFVAASNG